MKQIRCRNHYQSSSLGPARQKVPALVTLHGPNKFARPPKNGVREPLKMGMRVRHNREIFAATLGSSMKLGALNAS
jgi:hypothetical protein